MNYNSHKLSEELKTYYIPPPVKQPMSKNENDYGDSFQWTLSVERYLIKHLKATKNESKN